MNPFDAPITSADSEMCTCLPEPCMNLCPACSRARQRLRETGAQIPRLTEAQYLERAQQRAHAVVDKVKDEWPLLAMLFKGDLDDTLLEALASTRSTAHAEMCEVADDIVKAAAVCPDPKTATLYHAIAGLLRGDLQECLVRFIKGAKP